MEAKLKQVDCVVEVHDARIPLSGRNPKLAQKFLSVKPYILVLNKKDLISESDQSPIVSALNEKEGIKEVIFTNAKDGKCSGLKQV